MTHSGDDIRRLAALLREKRNLLASSPSLHANIIQLRVYFDHEISRTGGEIFKEFIKTFEARPLISKGNREILSEKVSLPSCGPLNYEEDIFTPDTLAQITTTTGCNVMIRGKGSKHDRDRSQRARNYDEDSNDKLHVLLLCDDTLNIARVMMVNGRKLVDKLIELATLTKYIWPIEQLGLNALQVLGDSPFNDPAANKLWSEHVGENRETNINAETEYKLIDDELMKKIFKNVFEE